LITDIELGMIPIGEIDEGKRAREEYGDLRELIESFKTEGIIQPIAVKLKSYNSDNLVPDHPGYLLLAGGRRFRAMKQMGIELVPCRVYSADLTEIEEKSIELRENLCRLDLTWLEKIRLEQQIHNLQIAIYGEKTSTSVDAKGWSKRDTADMLDKSPSSIVQDIMLSEAVEKIPELRDCKTKDEARKLLSIMQETMIKSELARRIEEQRARTPLDIARIGLCNGFIVKDFFTGIKDIQDRSVNLIELDPPYAIDLPNLKKMGSVESQEMKSYNEIVTEAYPDFIERVIHECYRVLADAGWLIIWFGPEPWFDYIYQIMTKEGFKLRRIPAIWAKRADEEGSGVGQTMQPSVYLGNAYEMFFYSRKGSPAICTQGRSNIFNYKPVSAPKKTHPTERPIEMIEDILKTFTVPGAKILVPFLGSGNTLLAASNLGMQAFGYELSQEYKDSFIMRVHEGKPGGYKSYE
jgi:site-specific DNA-methyltransferase (adenine-specific)